MVEVANNLTACIMEPIQKATVEEPTRVVYLDRTWKSNEILYSRKFSFEIERSKIKTMCEP